MNEILLLVRDVIVPEFSSLYISFCNRNCWTTLKETKVFSPPCLLENFSDPFLCTKQTNVQQTTKFTCCFKQINFKKILKNIEDNITIQQGRKYRYKDCVSLDFIFNKKKMLLKSFSLSIQYIQSILLNYPLQFCTT